MGRCFQQGLLLNYIKSNFLVNFSSFWYLRASYEYTNILQLTITLVIQAFKREINQYFATGRCFDKFYSGQKRWEGVFAMGRCFDKL